MGLEGKPNSRSLGRTLYEGGAASGDAPGTGPSQGGRCSGASAKPPPPPAGEPRLRVAGSLRPPQRSARPAETGAGGAQIPGSAGPASRPPRFLAPRPIWPKRCGSARNSSFLCVCAQPPAGTPGPRRSAHVPRNGEGPTHSGRGKRRPPAASRAAQPPPRGVFPAQVPRGARRSSAAPGCAQTLPAGTPPWPEAAFRPPGHRRPRGRSSVRPAGPTRWLPPPTSDAGLPRVTEHKKKKFQ